MPMKQGGHSPPGRRRDVCLRDKSQQETIMIDELSTAQLKASAPSACAHPRTVGYDRHNLLNDAILRRPEIFGGIKDLFGGRNVIVCAGQQIGGASDIVEIKLPAQADERALGKPIFLEQLAHHLQVPMVLPNTSNIRERTALPTGAFNGPPAASHLVLAPQSS